MNVGDKYDAVNSNCAHFVASWYKDNLGVTIPTTNTFEVSFVLWMRRHFKQIPFPVDGCLVKMKNHSGEAHVGVFTNYLVMHNFKPPNKKGSVCCWTLSAVKFNYKEVTFWRWSK